jgi:hypothetical protein
MYLDIYLGAYLGVYFPCRPLDILPDLQSLLLLALAKVSYQSGKLRIIFVELDRDADQQQVDEKKKCYRLP